MLPCIWVSSLARASLIHINGIRSGSWVKSTVLKRFRGFRLSMIKLIGSLLTTLLNPFLILEYPPLMPPLSIFYYSNYFLSASCLCSSWCYFRDLKTREAYISTVNSYINFRILHINDLDSDNYWVLRLSRYRDWKSNYLANLPFFVLRY